MLVGQDLDEINIIGSIQRSGAIPVVRLDAPIETVLLDVTPTPQELIFSDKDSQNSEFLVTYLGKELYLTSLTTVDAPLELRLIPIDGETAVIQVIAGEVGLTFHEETFIIDNLGDSYEVAEKEPLKALLISDILDTVASLILDASDDMEQEEAEDEVLGMCITLTITVQVSILRDETGKLDAHKLPDLIPDINYDYFELASLFSTEETFSTEAPVIYDVTGLADDETDDEETDDEETDIYVIDDDDEDEEDD